MTEDDPFGEKQSLLAKSQTRQSHDWRSDIGFGGDNEVNPFKTDLIMFSSFHMTAAPFWILFIINLLGPFVVLAIFILELVSIGVNKWNITSVPFPEDEYGLMCLSIPAIVLTGFELFAVFSGRLIFSSTIGQWGHFGVVFVLSMLSFFGSVVAFYMTGGRLEACGDSAIKKATCGKGPAPSLKGELTAILVFNIFLFLVTLTDLFMAFLLLFVKELQYMAIGMGKENRRTLRLITEPARRNRFIREWFELKNAGGDMRKKKRDQMLADSSTALDPGQKPKYDGSMTLLTGTAANGLGMLRKR